MDIDEILIDDDLDIEILEVKSKEDSASISSVRQPITKKETPPSNPVQEHLVKQLNCVQNQIDQAKSNIEVIDNVTEKILANLSKQAAYREEASSESDNDLFSSTGEPIVRRKKKKKKNKVHEKHKVIAVKDVWQRVVDDKWVIGVVIECSTTCILKEPTLYMCPKGRENNCHGISAFWALVAGLWYPIEEIDPNEESVATVVLDLPTFDEENPYHEAHGTIFCEFDDKSFQTPVPPIKLEAINVVDGSCALEFEENAKYSILALKALSIDKMVLLPVNPESNMGKRLMKFLETYAFQEICKVCIVRDIGSLQYCILEVLPADDDGDLRILLSARSEAQLSTMIQLMREDFPELLDIEKQQAIGEAAEALREELELYLTCDDAAKLQRARVKTDLLIP